MTKQAVSSTANGLLAAWLVVFGLCAHAAAQEPGPDEVAPEKEAPPEQAAPEQAAPEEPPQQGAPAEAIPAQPSASDEAQPVEGEVAANVGVGAEAGAEVQDEAPPEPPVEETGEMVVTGSRVKVKSAFAASAPVLVVDRKQLELAGNTNMADVVQSLTIAPGSGFQGEGQGLRQGRIGVTGVDLRGLGFGATLVLVNGRRLPISGGTAPGGGGATSDMGQIPLEAVERVEILKGGASAIYGSDAVAGVVNIITRKNWEGLRFEAEGEAADSFDYKGYNIGASFGAVGENARVMVAAAWDLHNDLNTDQRSWTWKGQLWSPVGYPGTYLDMGKTMGSPTMPDPACGTPSAPRSNVIEMAPSPGSMQPTFHCAFNDRDFQVLVPAVQRGNVFASGAYDLTEHTTAYIETNFSHMRADSLLWPFFVLPPFANNVPADHVDNPFGTDVRVNTRVTDIPTRLGAEDDTLRLVGTLGGDFGGLGEAVEDWEWELAFTWGVSRYRAALADNLRPAFQAGLNSCSDPADLSNCFNPFHSSRDGTGTPNSQKVLDEIQGESQSITDSGLRTYNAGMNGSLFELPGGDVGFALGGEIRHEWRLSDVDHDANLFKYGLRIGNTDYYAARDVYGGYLELRWPVYDGIEVQTAGRVDYYSDIEKSAANPTVGLTLIPGAMIGRDNAPEALRRLQIRAHGSTAFRAPEVLDASRNSVTVPTQMQVGRGLPSFFPVRTTGNPDLKHEEALAISAGFTWTVIDELSLLGEFWYFNYQDRIGREDPKQKVDAWQDAMAQLGPGNCLTDYPGIVVEDASTCLPSEVQVLTTNTAGKTLTDGIDFGVTIHLTGETFGGSAADWGVISFGAEGSYTLAFDIPRHAVLPAVIAQGIVECDGTAPDSSCSVVGNRNVNNVAPPLPALRMNIPVSWLYEGHALSFNGHYLGPLADDADQGRSGNFRGHIDSWFTMDVQYQYTIKDWVGDALILRIGVLNLADADPPIVTTETTGFDPMLHDPRGRLLYAKLISEF